MDTSKQVGTSGRGVKPLSVRRDVGVGERIGNFITKLKAIDSSFMPKPELLSGSASDQKKYKEKHRVWVSKIRDLVKTERRFLAAEGTAEGKKKARMRATTYRVRLSLYRRHIIQEMNFINPEFGIRARRLLESNLFSDQFSNKIKLLVREKSYQGLMKTIRDILVKEAESLSDAEFAAIKELKGFAHHPVIPLLNVGERLVTVIKKKAAEAQTARHTTAVRKISINFYLAWMDRILKNHKDHDWPNLAIALALATGRRPIELFVTAKFYDAMENTVMFSGQAKTKFAENKPYRIPVLYDVKVIQVALKKMRKSVAIPDGATNDDVNRLTAKTLSDRMKAVFEDRSIEFYALRAAYGRLCVQKFYSPSVGTEEHFLASILGHNEDDHATVQHYKTVVFDEEFTLKASAKLWEDISKAEEQQSPEGFVTKDLVNRVADQREKFSGAQARVFDFILDQLKRGNGGLTQSYITREGGFNRNAIKTVLAELGEIASPEAHKRGKRRTFRRA